MADWPLYVGAAAREMGYYDDDEAQFKPPVAAFAERWGGYGPEALTRALQVAEGVERLFTIWLLFYSATPRAREVAASFLTPGANQRERWCCALYLGTIRDARAIPVLEALLTEALPTPATYLSTWRQHEWHESIRIHAAILLGLIGDTTVVPALRTALQMMVHLEQAIVLHSGDVSDDIAIERCREYDEALDPIHDYQERLVYALGQLGALGALVGVPCDQSRLELWRVHLLMGHLHRSYTFLYLGRFADESDLLADITGYLTHIFGLTEDEQTQCLARYELEMLHSLLSFCYGLQRAEEFRLAE